MTFITPISFEERRARFLLNSPLSSLTAAERFKNTSHYFSDASYCLFLDPSDEIAETINDEDREFYGRGLGPQQFEF